MGLKVTIEGKIGEDCPSKDDLDELKTHMAANVRKRLSLGPDDIVIIKIEPKYTIEEKIKAQKEYAAKKNLPYFAPSNGICASCNHQIYIKISFKKASEDL